MHELCRVSSAPLYQVDGPESKANLRRVSSAPATLESLLSSLPAEDPKTTSEISQPRHHGSPRLMSDSTIRHSLRSIQAAHEYDRPLTPNESVLSYLKYVKPGDFENPNSLFRDLVLTVLSYRGDDANANPQDLLAQINTYLIGDQAPGIFSSEDQETLHKILSSRDQPEEAAFHLCLLLENSLNRYAPHLLIGDPDKTESQHMQDIKNNLVNYFSHSRTHQIAEGVRSDKVAKQLNNYLAYSIPSAIKKLMVIVAASATQSFDLNPDNVNSVTIRHSHDPVFGSISAAFISLLSAVQIYLTKPETNFTQFLGSLRSSLQQTYQSILFPNPENTDSRQPISQRIKTRLTELNQERWLLHLGGWSQLLNGLDHFLQLKDIKLPKFALSTALIYATAMSMAEVPHALHAARDYRTARRAANALERSLAQHPLNDDSHDVKSFLERSVHADIHKESQRDQDAAFWTLVINSTFATSMVSVLLGLITGTVAPAHTQNPHSLQTGNLSTHGLDPVKQHETHHASYAHQAIPILYTLLGTFWLTGMAAHVVAATRQYKNYRRAQENNAINATPGSSHSSHAMDNKNLELAPPRPTLERLEQAEPLPPRRTRWETLKSYLPSSSTPFSRFSSIFSPQ